MADETHGLRDRTLTLTAGEFIILMGILADVHKAFRAGKKRAIVRMTSELGVRALSILRKMRDNA